MGFEPIIPLFERAKKIRASDYTKTAPGKLILLLLFKTDPFPNSNRIIHQEMWLFSWQLQPTTHFVSITFWYLHFRTGISRFSALPSNYHSFSLSSLAPAAQPSAL
jgi:peptidoglycan biosynthesis protein MviN/MurJ (putative lipid II flippase)